MMEGIYGDPPRALASPCAGATQFSPFVLGSTALEATVAASIDIIIILAPAGTIERRSVLAQALRVLKPGGQLTALAPKTRGGSRLGAELAAFGCAVTEIAKAHHRICHAPRPDLILGLDDSIAAGALQVVPGLGLWSRPGLFSWDRIDPGSALLNTTGEPLAGRGVDVGCGYGALSIAVLKRDGVAELTLLDLDRRAIEAALRNVSDSRARFLQADARSALADMKDLDFAVINPPFHAIGREDRALGRDLVAAAARSLRRGGLCRVVANAALPYEAVLSAECATVRQLARANGFKVLEGRR